MCIGLFKVIPLESNCRFHIPEFIGVHCIKNLSTMILRLNIALNKTIVPCSPVFETESIQKILIYFENYIKKPNFFLSIESKKT